MRGFLKCREAKRCEPVRQLRLVDDADGGRVGIQPDRAGRLAVDVHAAFFSQISRRCRPLVGAPSVPHCPVPEAAMTIDLEKEYNNRARVPEHPEIFERWARDGEAYRRTEGAHLDLSYGPSPRQIIDVFPAGDARAPLALFIHGGWW